MFGKSSQYTALPQRDTGPANPGLFVAPERYGFMQTPFHHNGLSFDYIPNIRDNDFTDTKQGWLSWSCNLVVTFLVYLCTFITFPISGWFVLKTVPNYERVVVFRLGRVRPPKGPGVVLVLPLIDQWQRVDLRTRAFNTPPCHVTTRDGGLVAVGADVQFRIWSPVMSVVAVQDLNASTRLTAQKAMTHLLGKKTVREIQTEKIKLGEYLGADINEVTRPWGLEVDRVELTVGAVMRTPEESLSGQLLTTPPSGPLEGLAGTIQQLAAHFLGEGGVLQTQKADHVSWADELSAAPQAVSGHGSGEQLLGAVKLLLSESLVCQVGACFQFHITSSGGQHSSYYLDLSQGSGSAGAGSPDREPDVTLSMSDGDLLAMFEGGLRPFAAYSSGRLRVQGDLNTAMKLEEVIKLLRQ